ncbi:MAG: type VI secretion system protein TssA [Myxococcales bacterium]|nr:type VI secretion system protein TssA [Myxococcales bacterium]
MTPTFHFRSLGLGCLIAAGFEDVAAIDIDALLSEISADDPCGPDLEYDSELRELEQSAQGKPEQQMGDTIVAAQEPDWREVRKRAESLFSRTKDLRVTSHLVRALLHTAGFEGLCDGLALSRGLIERYWEPLHPRLDPDDDNDPTLRVNLVMSLCDQEDFLIHVRNTPIVSAPALGRFSLRELAIASGEVPAPAGEDPPSMSTIEGAFLEADLETLTQTSQNLAASLEHLREIEAKLTDHVGSANAPNLDPLRRLVYQASKVVKDKLAARNAGATPSEGTAPGEDVSGGGSGPAQPGARALSGDIRAREDVLRALDKIIEYYARHEPSSPVPILVRRCKRLVTASFEDIVKNLLPDGVSQLEVIKGPSEEMS